jgi:hypothetical protein
MTQTALSLAASKPARARKATKETKQSSTWRKAMVRQKIGAAVIGAVGLVATAESLRHQANGVEIMTGVDLVEAWLMAIVVDLGMISSELAGVLTVAEKVRAEVHRWTKPITIATALLSAFMNSLGFLQGAGDNIVHQVGAVVLGCFIPAMIFGVTRGAVRMFTDCQNKGI